VHRKTTSVLFGDLVGFTALSESKDVEDVRALLSRYFQLCRTAVERHGGTIEKFIGDAVMAVWGVPSVHEDDAERAVRAGLELATSIAALGDQLGVPALAMRVGIVTGRVAVTEGATGEGMVAGDAVNTAARVQTQAPPGRVWVDEATRRRAAAAVVFADAGRHTLKGKAAPVQLFEARAVVATVGGAQRWDGLVAQLTGRDRELSILKDLFHATVEDQRPRLLVVTGAAGVGKSRLGWEFEYYLDGLNDPVWWHRGRCPSYGDAAAFWALVEAFRGRFDIPDDAGVDVVDARLALGMARHVPDVEHRRWMEPRLATLLGGSAKLDDLARDDLFGAWAAFLGQLAASPEAGEAVERLAPVVLVVEDAHHADDGLLDFLEQTVDRAEFPLFVVVIARPELADRRPGLGSGRRRSSVYLEPLPDAQMSRLVDRLVHDLSEPSRKLLVWRAEGIPLFAVETVRSLIDRDAVVPREGRYVATPQTFATLEEVAAPPTFEALVAARLDALDVEARELLRNAAVLGLQFSVDGLAALGIPGTASAGPLGRLVRRDFLRPARRDRPDADGVYQFVQTVVRTVAYNSLSKHDRRSRHLAVVAHLEAQDDPAGELAPIIAAHLIDAVTAAPGNEDARLRARAQDVLLRAGRRALLIGAPAEALTLGRRALDLALQGHGEEGAPLDLCALASRRTGDLESARTWGEKAIASHERAGRLPAAARSAAETARILGVGGRSSQAARLLLPWYHRTVAWAADPELTAEQRDDAEAATVEVLDALASALVIGPPTEGPVEAWPEFAVVAERLLVLAERRADVKRLAHALNIQGWNLHERGARQVAMALWRHATSVTQAAGRSWEGLIPMVNLLSSSVPYALTDARSFGAQAMELAERVNDRWTLTLVRFNLALVCWLDGDWSRLRTLAEGMVAGESTDVDMLLLAVRLAAEASGDLGAPGEPIGEDQPAVDDENLDPDVRAWSLVTQEISRARPDPATLERAVSLHHAALGLGEDFWWLWTTVLDHLLDGADLDHARRLVDLLDRADGVDVSPLLHAQHLRLRGELARLAGGIGPDTESDLRAAVRALDDFGARFHAARARLSLGRALVDAGRAAEAESLLEAARHAFDELGAVPWRERAGRLLPGPMEQSRLSGAGPGAS
jgi:class 3 adenylate cyclase/tetratricopeptide (TPR) repeat protein